MTSLPILYSAGAVTRYHTVRMNRPQTIADHTWGVLLIAMQVDPDVSINLVKAIMYHDAPEVITGDIPATAKWSSARLCEALDELEDEFNSDHCADDYRLSEYEAWLLKFCDTAELILHCIEEYKSGNRFAQEIGRRGLNHLFKMFPYGYADNKALDSFMKENLPRWSEELK